MKQEFSTNCLSVMVETVRNTRYPHTRALNRKQCRFFFFDKLQKITLYWLHLKKGLEKICPFWHSHTFWSLHGLIFIGICSNELGLVTLVVNRHHQDIIFCFTSQKMRVTYFLAPFLFQSSPWAVSAVLLTCQTSPGWRCSVSMLMRSVPKTFLLKPPTVCDMLLSLMCRGFRNVSICNTCHAIMLHCIFLILLTLLFIKTWLHNVCLSCYESC